MLLFTDPPFGCRTELLAATIKTITQRYQSFNALSQRILPTMWIFPYFMETYIHQVMPEMQMAAYRVNYTNHSSYHEASDKGGRKQGSPIRIFANIPLNLLTLPASEGYAWCAPCRKWRAADEKHCLKCGDCSSKNGALYVHCELCAECVKPNYRHCERCNRCTQVSGHSCDNYETHLTCWICGKKGHNERKCTSWLTGRGLKILRKYNHMKKSKRCAQRRLCLVCGGHGHNERRCLKRGELLYERTFMQEVFNIFNTE